MNVTSPNKPAAANPAIASGLQSGRHWRGLLSRDVMLRSLALIFPLLLLGCATPQTVNRAELERLKSHWHEPKVSIWYYVGSKDGFHYFRHYDFGSEKKYFRISDAELSWEDTFPLTPHRKNWRALKWGVYERM